MAFLLEVEDCSFKVFKITKCRSSQNKVKSLNLGKIGCKSGSRIDASDATLASQKLIFKLISFIQQRIDFQMAPNSFKRILRRKTHLQVKDRPRAHPSFKWQSCDWLL